MVDYATTIGNQDYRIYEQNGKYCVSHSSNDGKKDAGISTFDTPEEANEYLKSAGVKDTFLLFDENDDSIMSGGKYTKSVGRYAKALTKDSVLDVITDGKFSDFYADLSEKTARFSLFNVAEKTFNNIPGSEYTQDVHDNVKTLTKNSLLDLVTDGKFSDTMAIAAENMSKMSLFNLLS